jgi:hypothetical protein
VSFNRQLLADYFGISIPQVSLDIAAYTNIASKNIRYDRSAKEFTRTPDFKRKWP